MDFYKRRKFICELTGHSCLTYFEALQSEATESEKIMKNFPEALKEPILRRIQFSQITRLDALVDDVYNSLRGDFFPGEVVLAKVRDQRIRVIIREKAQFNAITRSDGQVQDPYARFRVEMVANSSQDLSVDQSQLSRDRKIFTKVILRTFIKHSVTREAWNGAPWIVKHEYAQAYRIDQTLPAHLLNSPGGRRKDMAKLRKLQSKFTTKSKDNKKTTTTQQNQYEGTMYPIPGYPPPIIPHIPPPPPGMPMAQFQQIMTLPPGLPMVPVPPPIYPVPPHHHHHHPPPPPPPPQHPHHQFHQVVGDGNPKSSRNSIDAESSDGARIIIENGNGSSSGGPRRRGRVPNEQKMGPPPEKPRVREDLEYSYVNSRALERAKFPFKHEKSLGDDDQHLIGTLLETWLFLNVYHEALLVDSFTFDDFVDALKYSDGETECSLINEIHCAMLSVIVSNSKAEIAVRLPDVEDDDEEEEEEHDTNDSDENAAKKEEGNESTVNGGNKQDNEAGQKEEGNGKMDVDSDQENNDNDDDDNDNNDDDNDDEDDENTENRASEFLRYGNQDWKERLKRRMFKDGGWQQILIGLLDTVSYVEEWSETCTKALNILASNDRPVSLQSAHEGYYELPFELRIKVLDIIACLLHGSDMVRNHIDECLEESTRVRRERADKQRELKVLQDEVKVIEDEKRKFFPHGYSGLTDEERKGLTMEEQSRLRKKKRIDAEEIKAKDDEEFSKVFEKFKTKYSQVEELLTEMRQYDDELSRLDCQRLRMLGKDRYHNRYWWFEANGMARPDKELLVESKEDRQGEEKAPDSDTDKSNGNKSQKTGKGDDGDDSDDSDNDNDEDENPTGYAMGRLWVQGPTDEDAKAFLEYARDVLEPRVETTDDGERIINDEKVIDKDGTCSRELKMIERKKLEEGSGFLKTMEQWGYYDTPQEIDNLMQWLNRYGKRELRLYKELDLIKVRMLSSIQSRHEDLEADEHHRKREIEEELAEIDFTKESSDEAEDDHNESDDEDNLISRRRRRSSRLSGPQQPAAKKQKRELTDEELEKKKRAKREELEQDMAESIPNRVLQWTNSLAIDATGYTHYDAQRNKANKKK